MPNYTYAGEVPKDDDAKKFMGASIDEGAANSFIAIKGYNLDTVHGEKVVDMGVKDTDLEVAVDAVNTTLGDISAQLPATLGKKPNADSISVTLASDEPETYVQIANHVSATVIHNAADPTGAANLSDITRLAGVALDASDFDIRDTNIHYYVIPLNYLGWVDTVICVDIIGIDVVGKCGIWGMMDDTSTMVDLLNIATPIPPDPNSHRFAFGNGAIGVGGEAGAATAADDAWYNVPALAARLPYVALWIQMTPGAPTVGTIELRVNRSQ